jgi:hemerythrin-like domain-containing protein
MPRSPVGPLVHEHRSIEKVLAALRVVLGEVDRSGSVDSRPVELATDYIRWFADRCHHAKEEQILFPGLRAKELDPELVTIMDGLIEDHATVRETNRQLAVANHRFAGGDVSALPEIRSAIELLVDLYPRHVETEERHFFRPALAYLTPEEQAKMLADMDVLERTLLHERYEATVAEIDELLGIPAS